MPITAIIGAGSVNSFSLVDSNIRLSTSSNSWNQTVSLGAADPERTIIIAFCWRLRSNSDSTTSVSVSLDGSPMTLIGYEPNGRIFEGCLGLGFWYLEVPTGTSAAVQFSVNDLSGTARDMSYAAYRVINCDPASFIYAGNSGGSVDSTTLTVATEGYGMVQAISDNDGNTNNFTGTNIVTVEGGTSAGAHAYRIVSGAVLHEATGADGVARLSGEYI
jgi:hypothetical protein